MPLEFYELFTQLCQTVSLYFIEPAKPDVVADIVPFIFDDLFSLKYAPDLPKDKVFTVFHFHKIAPMF